MSRGVSLKDPIAFYIEKQKQRQPSLRFDKDKDFDGQKKAIRDRFCQLIKYREPMADPTVLELSHDTTDPRFDEFRFLIETEPGFYVPAHLLVPKQYRGKLPLVICLQGHSTGMHVSLGREAYPGKAPIPVQGDRDFCIQAVARGYAALALEQRGFGELNFTEEAFSCHLLTWQCALMGRTLLADRLMDISCAITAVENSFAFIDREKIGIMGNSGGGTSAYYAACLDERIKVAMPASSFAEYIGSWGSLHHCDCAYINGILDYMDMGDLAILVAPRYLVVVNGQLDHIQPIDGAKREFERAKEIYDRAGAADHCHMVVGPEGHRFYADLSWDIFDKFMQSELF